MECKARQGTNAMDSKTSTEDGCTQAQKADIPQLINPTKLAVGVLLLEETASKTDSSLNPSNSTAAILVLEDTASMLDSIVPQTAVTNNPNPSEISITYTAATQLNHTLL
ncbi:hypothetical protein ACH5RR_032235 [Cinchona calisaya]|uniref:Uncharacterized protein n=1 Tax=Cinchona calisaya TaxID=153742 RepID=A0ABD2YMT4_9GENT